MKRFFTILSILFISAQAFSQDVCGTTYNQDVRKRIMASKASFQNLDIYTVEDVNYVPIKFHLIAKTDGTGRVKESYMLKQLCILNEDFSATDLQFYIKDVEFSYYNSSLVYDTPRFNSTAGFQMQALKNTNNNAINIFVVNNIEPFSGTDGTVLGYYDPSKDWVVLLKKEAQSGSNTLSHELGHFFSLAHPFDGWNAQFDDSYPGFPNAPANLPNGGGPSEHQDGTNCEVAADMVCDTPPDYSLGNVWHNCNYAGGAMDSKGVLIDPMENNQMGYFSGCYPYVFTPDQIDLMHGDYAKASRNYLKSSFVPNTTQATDKVTLTSPGNNATSTGTTGVVLDWEDVPGAAHYLVEVSRTLNFSSQNLTYIVAESQKELPELTTDKNYFWKVSPFNDGASCITGLTSARWKFVSSPVAVSNIEEINAWDVMPNPTTASNVKFVIELDKPVDITAQLISLNGQTLSSKSLKVNTGSQVVTMPSVELSSGQYFLRLMSEKGVETRRVVIQK